MRKLLQIAVVMTGVMMAGCSGMGGSSGLLVTPGGQQYQQTPTNAIPISG